MLSQVVLITSLVAHVDLGCGQTDHGHSLSLARRLLLRAVSLRRWRVVVALLELSTLTALQLRIVLLVVLA